MTRYPSASRYSAWTKRDIQLSDLGPPLGTAEFTRRFRSEEPVLLRYDVDVLNWRGLIFCAPMASALAMQDLVQRNQFQPLVEWGRRLIDDPEIYKQFMSAIRKARIGKDDVPMTLTWPYCGFGAYVDSSKPPFGRSGRVPDALRVLGCLIPRAAAVHYERLLDELILNAGHWAFCEASENVRAGSVPIHDRSGISRLFASPVYVRGEPAQARRSRLETLSSELSDAIDYWSSRPDTTFDAHCHDVVRPPLELFGVGFVLGMEAAFDELTEQVIANRIALARTLAWPTFLGPLKEASSAFKGRANPDAPCLSRTSARLDDAIRYLRERHDWLSALEEFRGFEALQ